MCKQTNKWGVKLSFFKHEFALTSTGQSFARNATFMKKFKLWSKIPPKTNWLYGSWSGFKSTSYSVKYNTKCEARPGTRSWYFWLKHYLRRLECKEIDANHCRKWVWTDSPSANVVATSSLKEELASNKEESSIHLTPTAKISKWQTSNRSLWIFKTRLHQSACKYFMIL